MFGVLCHSAQWDMDCTDQQAIDGSKARQLQFIGMFVVTRCDTARLAAQAHSSS
jgi:hypothetical protein